MCACAILCIKCSTLYVHVYIYIYIVYSHHPRYFITYSHKLSSCLPHTYFIFLLENEMKQKKKLSSRTLSLSCSVYTRMRWPLNETRRDAHIGMGLMRMLSQTWTEHTLPLPNADNIYVRLSPKTLRACHVCVLDIYDHRAGWLRVAKTLAHTHTLIGIEECQNNCYKWWYIMRINDILLRNTHIICEWKELRLSIEFCVHVGE